MLTKIINYPVTKPLKRVEQDLLWKYRYYLTQNKKVFLNSTVNHRTN
jgi:hypothetical protein